ncbi:Hypothetical predicted protein [Paramuricea clavata]|uniref:Uncharacterized protein n=1 Tax=Paramuricea clavata TaxID=317549 RepID=A0A6S7GK90_PARCT|nr:Hypothetical predicted protein [Paramuricea clavata]
MLKPTQADLSTAKHVLRYLKGTQVLGLTFRKSCSPLILKGFCDSDWGASIEDRRSVTGYNFQLTQDGPMISWKSRKQPTVALSTCEAEYVALANAIQEAKFLQQLCKDMRVSIEGQNTDIKYHFIRSEIQEGRIILEYIPSEENVADIFTKPASKIKLGRFGGIMSGK